MMDGGKGRRRRETGRIKFRDVHTPPWEGGEMKEQDRSMKARREKVNDSGRKIERIDESEGGIMNEGKNEREEGGENKGMSEVRM